MKVETIKVEIIFKHHLSRLNAQTEELRLFHSLMYLGIILLNRLQNKVKLITLAAVSFTIKASNTQAKLTSKYSNLPPVHLTEEQLELFFF